MDNWRVSICFNVRFYTQNCPMQSYITIFLFFELLKTEIKHFIPVNVNRKYWKCLIRSVEAVCLQICIYPSIHPKWGKIHITFKAILFII